MPTKNSIKLAILLLFASCLASTIVRAQTVSTFDVLVATRSLTVVGTATVTGSAFSVGISTAIFVVDNAHVGIGTASSGLLHIMENQGGTKREFLWSSQGALRTGHRSAEALWSNPGLYSFSSGNDQQALGSHSAIVGGDENTIAATSGDSFIGGGGGNFAETGSATSAIVGGSANTTQNSQAFIGGGEFNRAYGYNSAIIGGSNNEVTGSRSVIVGGIENSASGELSFAAGSYAQATAKGSFVWSDSQTGDFFTSARIDEFRARANGGFVFYASTALPTVIVSSGAVMISTSATAAGAVPNIYISSMNGGVGIGNSSPSVPLQVTGAAAFSSGITASSGSFAATGATQYSITSSSGIKIQNNGCLTFGDGTYQCTKASGGGSGGAAVSFSTINSIAVGVTISSTIPSVCIPGSTITITASGNYPVVFNATIMAQVSANQVIFFSVLENGAFPPQLKSTVALAAKDENTTVRAFSIPIHYMRNSNAPAGSLSYCITGWVTAGTATIGETNSGYSTVNSESLAEVH